MYDDLPEVTFSVAMPGEGVEMGAIGRLISLDEDAGTAEVRVYGKTLTVDAGNLEFPEKDLPEPEPESELTEPEAPGNGEGGDVPDTSKEE